MYTVYKHTTPSGKVYIGITGLKLEDRFQNGKGYNGMVFFNAIKKYGWENIAHEVVASGLTKEEAARMEIELIREYKSNSPKYGYNVSSGGECGTAGCKFTRSAETLKRMSEAQRGKKLSDSTKKKISASLIGNKHNLGNSASEETRLKMRMARIGRHLSDEARSKLREANKGKILSQETRRKISENNARPMLGKKHAQSTRQKIADAHRREVAQYDECGELLKIYPSASEAARMNGWSQGNISMVCRGERKKAYGYVWRYKEV